MGDVLVTFLLNTFATILLLKAARNKTTTIILKLSIHLNNGLKCVAAAGPQFSHEGLLMDEIMATAGPYRENEQRWAQAQ